jgi:hypothetical protein
MFIVWCKDVLRFHSVLVRNLSEKQEKWGEFTLQQVEDQTLQQQIYTAFHRRETLIG